MHGSIVLAASAVPFARLATAEGIVVDFDDRDYPGELGARQAIFVDEPTASLDERNRATVAAVMCVEASGESGWQLTASSSGHAFAATSG